MMRVIRNVVLLLMLCVMVFGDFPAHAADIGGFNVEVLMRDKHPFFPDHKRTLVVRKGQHTVAERNIYMDTGTRVPLHVYEQEGDFVFIDANGAWYLLNSQEQSLVQLEWSWNKELPAYYLGTFRLRPGDTVPSFVKESVPEKKDVYLFKDPPAQ